jgi:hypothetical protein
MAVVEAKRSIESPEGSQGALDAGERQAVSRSHSPERSSLLISLFLCGILLIGFAFVQGRNIDASFSNDYDEGVYLSSARMLNLGHPLFASVFSSQPPVFLESLAVCFRVFGDSVAAGRGMTLFFACVNLVAIAWVAGRLLHPPAAPFAMTCLGLTLCFFQNARNCTAEMPSLAFALVAICLIVSPFWKWPLIRFGLSGASFAAAVLTKLLVAPMLLPLLVVICVPQNGLHCRRELDGAAGWRSLLFRILAFGTGGCIFGILVLMRYDFTSMYDQVVRFHEASKQAYPLSLGRNAGTLKDYALSGFGIVASAVGGLVLLWWRNRWVCVWISLWLCATVGFILIHSPLFDRHLLLAAPPIALAASASVSWRPLAGRGARLNFLGLYFAALSLISLDSRSGEIDLSCMRGWRSLSRNFPAEQKRAIELIQGQTKPDEFVVSDEQMQAFRAGRCIPPWLCDTSFNRIRSGYLNEAEAIRASAGARMVIIWTHRLQGLPGFEMWVESHFNLVNDLDGKRIYVRKENAPAL